MTKTKKVTKRRKGQSASKARLGNSEQERKAVKRVLRLVDGYLSTQQSGMLLSYNGRIMTWGELRLHVQAAMKVGILKT